MFVTDTVDAVYRPEEWFPEGLMDQLAEIVSDLPIPEAKASLQARSRNRHSFFDSLPRRQKEARSSFQPHSRPMPTWTLLLGRTFL